MQHSKTYLPEEKKINCHKTRIIIRFISDFFINDCLKKRIVGISFFKSSKRHC